MTDVLKLIKLGPILAELSVSIFFPETPYTILTTTNPINSEVGRTL